MKDIDLDSKLSNSIELSYALNVFRHCKLDFREEAKHDLFRAFRGTVIQTLKEEGYYTLADRIK